MVLSCSLLYSENLKKNISYKRLELNTRFIWSCVHSYKQYTCHPALSKALLTGCNHCAGRNLAEVTVLPVINVGSAAIFTHQLVVIRTPVSGPVGLSPTISIATYCQMFHKRNISTLCKKKKILKITFLLHITQFMWALFFFERGGGPSSF